MRLITYGHLRYASSHGVIRMNNQLTIGMTAEQCAALLASHGGFNPTDVLRQLLTVLNREEKLRNSLNDLIKESNQYRMNVNALMRDIGGFAETIEGKSSQFHQRIQEADEALSV